jgi:hypothetical protein
MNKVTKKAAIDYEQPQVTTILLAVEQGFGGSGSSSVLDDMTESSGEWLVY